MPAKIGFNCSNAYQLIWNSLVRNSLGTNSSMFANCLVFWDVQHVWSSVFGQNVMLGKFDVSLMFRYSMFGVFEVWYFGVCSMTSSKPECAM